MKKTAFFGSAEVIDRVYAQGRREEAAAISDLMAPVINAENFADHLAELKEVEAIFSTWGMPVLSPEQWDQLLALRAVFYAAGSVKHFAEPLLDREILVVSGWMANAIPVAEFTVAQIILAMKGCPANTRDFRSHRDYDQAFRGPGNWRESVALLGAGAIGRKVIELLRPFHSPILVFDPFLSDEAAADLDVEKVTLAEAFARAFVVSNHLADVPETVGLLDRGLFERMLPHAVFINTGRGATVDEAGLQHVLAARPDLTALLDVTHPEPPVEGSPFYSLPNVSLTTHLAGSINDEAVRMADYCLEEFSAWAAGRPLRYAVNREMLATIA